MATRLQSRYRVHKKTECEECGFKPSDPRQLDVHHLDLDKTNNDPENLKTLCANCHRLVHYPPKPGARRGGRPSLGLDSRIHLRLPADLHDRLRQAAENEGRSINSVIVAALLDAYPEREIPVEEVHLQDVRMPDEPLVVPVQKVSLAEVKAEFGTADPETCPHEDRILNPSGITECRACRSTRPRWAWLPPEA